MNLRHPNKLVSHVLGVLALTLIGAVAPAARAGTIVQGRVTSIGFSSEANNYAFLHMDRNITNRAACVGSTSANIIVVDHGTTKGKAMFSTLLAGFLAGKSFNLASNLVAGTCVTMNYTGGSYTTEQLTDFSVNQ